MSGSGVRKMRATGFVALRFAIRDEELDYAVVSSIVSGL